MAIIYREPGSFIALKKELNKRKITRFDSLSEIAVFMNEYENEKLKIIENVKSEINQEVISKRERIKINKKELTILIDLLTRELTGRIERNSRRLTKLNINHSNIIIRLINKLRHHILAKRLDYLNHNFNKIIQKKSRKIERKLLTDQSEIDYILTNKEKVLLKRSKKETEELNYIHKNLEELYPLVTGAIGESLVEKEIGKLDDNYILINDFKLRFDKPIYNKRTRDRIHSIQIDHLLISPAGIFLIETKNWSKESINNLDIRSPVEQIQRTNFAMFVTLNSISKRFGKIQKHHWGESQIPLRNLIVMINNKPLNSFKFVKVLKLNELNNYIFRFEEIYSKKDVHEIGEVLLKLL